MAVAYKALYTESLKREEEFVQHQLTQAAEIERLMAVVADLQAQLQPRSLEFPLALDVRVYEAKHFVIIGAGGNGGYLIPSLLRQVALANKMLKLKNKSTPLHRVTIVDADDVEEKNLNRQNFIRSDISKKKAEVMADRYGRAFGLEIQFVDAYVENTKHLSDIVLSQKGTPFVIGCVDNNKSRKIIHDWIQNQNNAWWLDAGNEEWGGQVVCGYKYGVAPSKGSAGNVSQFNIPLVTDLYPEILEGNDKLPTEMSCAERSVSAPQNIFTNQLCATVMMSFLNQVLTADGGKGEGLKHHAVAFNARTFSTTNKLNTIDNLSVRAPKVEPKAEDVPTAVEAPKEVAEAVATA